MRARWPRWLRRHYPTASYAIAEQPEKQHSVGGSCPTASQVTRLRHPVAANVALSRTGMYARGRNRGVERFPSMDETTAQGGKTAVSSAGQGPDKLLLENKREMPPLFMENHVSNILKAILKSTRGRILRKRRGGGWWARSTARRSHTADPSGSSSLRAPTDRRKQRLRVGKGGGEGMQNVSADTS